MRVSRYNSAVFIGSKHVNSQGLTFQVMSKGVSKNGNLGYIVRFEESGFTTLARRNRITSGQVKDRKARTLHGVACGYVDDATQALPYYQRLRKIWANFMLRCYAATSEKYHIYGGKGVRFCDRWLDLQAFVDDAPSLPGFDLWVAEKGRVCTRLVFETESLELSPTTFRFVQV